MRYEERWPRRLAIPAPRFPLLLDGLAEASDNATDLLRLCEERREIGFAEILKIAG
jgi:hypothetical protein